MDGSVRKKSNIKRLLTKAQTKRLVKFLQNNLIMSK